jgi:hypothetical protein
VSSDDDLPGLTRAIGLDAEHRSRYERHLRIAVAVRE